LAVPAAAETLVGRLADVGGKEDEGCRDEGGGGEESDDDEEAPSSPFLLLFFLPDMV